MLAAIAFLLVACGNDKTEKNESEPKTMFDNYDDYAVHFRGLFKHDLGECSINKHGKISIDNGSMSAGRVEFYIAEVDISMEEKPEEPGCADVCPPRTIISFHCTGRDNCIKDPAMDFEYSSGILEYGVEHGKKAFEFLIDFQNFLLAQSTNK